MRAPESGLKSNGSQGSQHGRKHGKTRNNGEKTNSVHVPTTRTCAWAHLAGAFTAIILLQLVPRVPLIQSPPAYPSHISHISPSSTVVPAEHAVSPALCETCCGRSTPVQPETGHAESLCTCASCCLSPITLNRNAAHLCRWCSQQAHFSAGVRTLPMQASEAHRSLYSSTSNWSHVLHQPCTRSSCGRHKEPMDQALHPAGLHCEQTLASGGTGVQHPLHPRC